MGQAEALQVFQYGVGDMPGAGQVGIRQNERKFFTAVTGHQVVRSLNGSIQQFGQGAQAAVSSGVAIAVIVGFEVVYIC